MRDSVLIAAMVAVVAAWCTPLFAQQVPQVLYYRFNEGTGTTTTNHAVPGSGTATLPLNTGHIWVAGQLNGCIRATAPGSMITGLAPNFTNNDSFTIEFWIRGAATTTLGYIMGESSTSVRIFTGGAAPSPGGILWQSAGGWSQCSATGFFDGTWHHCAFVFDSIAKTMTLYRDGVHRRRPERPADDRGFGRAPGLVGEARGDPAAVGLAAREGDAEVVEDQGPGVVEKRRRHGLQGKGHVVFRESFADRGRHQESCRVWAADRDRAAGSAKRSSSASSAAFRVTCARSSMVIIRSRIARLSPWSRRCWRLACIARTPVRSTRLA
jgi:hypothetical protein